MQNLVGGLTIAVIHIFHPKQLLQLGAIAVAHIQQDLGEYQ